MKVNTNIQSFVACVIMAILCISCSNSGSKKPRVILATDPIELNENYQYVDEDINAGDPETGDPDDMQSMVQFLLYANVFQVEGIIASSERIDDGKNKVWVNRDYSLYRIIDKYDEVDENLRLHDAAYPTADYLRSKIRKGYSHPTGSALPGPGKDTPGSDLIIEVVDASDEPLWYLDWVGQPQQFELSQALWKVKNERSPKQLKEFVSKIRASYIQISNSGPGSWLRENFPDLFLIGTHYVLNDSVSSGRSFWGLSSTFMEGADSSIWNLEWANSHIINDHGALGAMFPSHTHDKKPGVSYFDSRTFFHIIPNGLCDPTDPSMGGWGGRYYKVEGTNHWAPAEDHHPTSSERDQRIYYSVGRYQNAMQADFQAKMDRCVGKVNEVNQNPIAIINKDQTKNVLYVTAKPGSVINLDAARSSDPDNDELSFRWWQYIEAGTSSDTLSINNPTNSEITVLVPLRREENSWHVILEVTDNGNPKLTSYRRVVISTCI